MDISREVLIEALKGSKEARGRAYTFNDILKTIDEQPPSRGEEEWHETKIGTLPARQCSACGNTIPIIVGENGAEVLCWEYCSKCGCYMHIKQEVVEAPEIRLVPIKEYCAKYGYQDGTVRAMIRRGLFKNCKKIGVNWFLDINEKPNYKFEK